MIKTIIFDFGGVLGTDADTIFVDVLVANNVKKKKAIAIWKKYWSKLKSGSENVNKIWDNVQNETKYDIHKLIKEYEKKISGISRNDKSL